MALIRASSNVDNVTPDTDKDVPRLDDADPRRRRLALHAQAADPSAWQEMADRLAVESDPHVRIVLVGCLVDTRSLVAAQAFLDCLGSEDVALRNLAVQGLTDLPEQALSLLPAALVDADVDVRIFATMVLGAIGGPRACELLCSVLERETHVNVVDAAINGLIDVGSAAHLGALQAVRQRFAGDPYVEFAVEAASAALRHAVPSTQS